MTALIDIENENRLLIAFLEGDAVARDEFPEKMMPHILRTARAVAKDLPEGLREEIAQQTFQNLLFTSPAKFDPARGTAQKFLIGQIWNAEKQIRAAYCYPPRRREKDSQNVENTVTATRFPKIISIDAEETIGLPAVNFEKTFEEKLFVGTVIRKAPKPLASVLRLIYFQEKTKQQAAEIVGLSRFQIHRQIKHLRSQLLAA